MVYNIEYGFGLFDFSIRLLYENVSAQIDKINFNTNIISYLLRLEKWTEKNSLNNLT